MQNDKPVYPAMSLDEFVEILPILQMMRSAAEENSDASKSTISITQDAQDAQEVHENEQKSLVIDNFQSSDEKSLVKKALAESGLHLASEAGTSHHPSTNVLACDSTLIKGIRLLGYEDFKNAINAIHIAWSKYYNGVQWNRMIVKDVIIFVKHCRSLNYKVNFQILSQCLSHAKHGGKIITPMEMLNKINSHNAGETTLMRYNSYLGSSKMEKIPELTKKEKREIWHI